MTLRFTLGALALMSLLCPVLAQADTPTASTEDDLWLLNMSEPEHFKGTAAQVEQAQFERMIGAASTQLEVSHQLPACAKTVDPAALSLSQLVEVATAHRLRGNAPAAMRWYALVMQRSDDPRHAYFYQQAERTLVAYTPTGR